MLNKKLVLLIFLSSIMMISAVGAADNATSPPVAESYSDSFLNLNTTINSNQDSDVYLNEDYAFDAKCDGRFTEGISIDRDVVIHGNSHVIDASGKAKIFNVKYPSKVTFTDIIFKNAYSPKSSGGAIIGGNSINCTFINNFASDGGAVSGGRHINATFIGNSASFQAGALYGGTAIGSTFLKNHAVECGAASQASVYDSYFEANSATYYDAVASSKVFNSIFNNTDATQSILGYVDAVNCTFSNNHVTSSIAEFGSITNCSFKDNIADFSIIFESDVVNSIFISNNAKSTSILANSYALNCSFIANSGMWGGATYKTTAVNSTFSNNTALYGGAMAGGNAINCIFTNNYAKMGAIMALCYDFDTDCFDNCTFSNNRAANAKDFIILDEYSFFEIYSNCQYGGYLKGRLYDGCEEGTFSDAIIHITLNGKTKNVRPDSKGYFKMLIDVVPKTYKVTFSIEKKLDTKYYSYVVPNFENVTSIIVKKDTPKLTAAKKTFKSSLKTKKYIITLKNNQNKAIKNAKVTLKVNKKTYSAITNSKGQATFKITKLTKRGTFSATVKYAGSKYHASKAVNTKITCK